MAKQIALRTDRLLLRRFQNGDVDDALSYRNDEQFSRFLPHIPHPFTLQHAEDFVRRNMTEPWERSPTFAVIFEDRLIGTVNLEIDPDLKTAMLGYAIGRQWWGCGIATEAAHAVLDWSVHTLDLTRVWASTDIDHFKSQRVLGKLGLTRESVHRGHHLGRQGEPIDEVVYAREIPIRDRER